MLLLGTDGGAEEKTCRMCASNRLLFVRFFLAFSLHDDSLMPEVQAIYHWLLLMCCLVTLITPSLPEKALLLWSVIFFFSSSSQLELLAFQSVAHNCAKCFVYPPKKILKKRASGVHQVLHNTKLNITSPSVRLYCTLSCFLTMRAHQKQKIINKYRNKKKRLLLFSSKRNIGALHWREGAPNKIKAGPAMQRDGRTDVGLDEDAEWKTRLSLSTF